MQKYIKSPHRPISKLSGVVRRLVPSCFPFNRPARKKISLTGFFLVCGLFLPLPALTQTLGSKTNERMHFGVTIGGACNTTYPGSGAWDFRPAQTKIGVGGGAYFQMDFAKRFFAYLELGISDRKLLANSVSADTAYGNFDISCSYTHISAPIGIGINLFPEQSAFNTSIIAAAVVGLPQENKSEISVKDQNIEKRLNPVGIGAMLELRLRYEFVFLSFRYEFSGTNVFKYSDQAFKTGTFSFFLGFQIF